MGLRDTISRLPLLVALFLLPAGAVCQIGDASQAKHTISGQVVNSVTGQPIAGALVQFGGQNGMLTDREGQFEFHDVDGIYGVGIATKPGYFPDQNRFMDAANAVQEKQPILLKLVPEAIVSGKVLDQNGQPLQGLQVQLKTLQVRNGLRHWQQTQGTMTSVEGEYRFADLPAGKYSLSTGFHIDGSPDAPSAVAFAPVVYPPLSGAQESALTLSAGDHVDANLNPPTQRLYPVTGHIDGLATMGVNFEAEQSSGVMVQPVVRFNRFNGDFRLLLPSGTYRLKVHGFAQREQFFAMREISLSEAPLKNISITLSPLATIPVEVEYQARSASSQENQPPPQLFGIVQLEETDPSGLGRMFQAQPLQPSQPSDSIAILGVEPGQYRLVAGQAVTWYVASAVCGNLDLKRELLNIAGGAAGCSIRAVLRNDSASLHWSINTSGQGSGRRQILVYVLPLDNYIQSLSMSGGQQGPGEVAEGTLEGLAPGRYLIMALDHQEELPYREPDLFQRYLSLGKEVTLTANGKADVQLDVVTGEP